MSYVVRCQAMTAEKGTLGEVRIVFHVLVNVVVHLRALSQVSCFIRNLQIPDSPRGVDLQDHTRHGSP